MICLCEDDLVTAINLSMLIATKMNIEAVQAQTSIKSHMKQRCSPKIQLPRYQYIVESGRTTTPIVRSATLNENISMYAAPLNLF